MERLNNIPNFIKNNLPVAFLLALTALILSSSMIMIIPLVLLGMVFFIVGEKIIYPFLIIIMIALPGDIGEGIRNTLNIVSIFFLMFLFIKKYQLDFDKYIKNDKVFFRFILLILSSLFLSTLFSKNIAVSLIEVFRQFVFFVIFYFLYSEFIERKKVFHVLLPIVLGGTLVSLGILYNLLNSGMKLVFLELAGLANSGGFYNNVAAAGGLLAISLPLTIAFLFLDKGKEKKVKILIALLILFQIIALLATNSRGAILSVFVSLILFSYLLSPKIFRKILILIAMISIIVFLLPTTSEAVNLYFRTGRILENTRYLIWQMAFSMIGDNLFLGVGPGMFKYYMYPNLPVMLGSWNENSIAWVYKNSGGGQAHNFLIMQTSELGLVGLIISLFFLVYVLTTSFQVMKLVRSISHQYYILSSAIFSIFVGLVFRSMFEATGIISNGWLSRDLPFWLLFLSVLILKFIAMEFKNK